VDDPIEGLDDAVLLTLVQARDAAAFRVLYDRYRVLLVRFAYRYARSVPLAEDLVQTVFTQLWCREAAWDVRTTVQAYLFHAVRHEAARCVDRMRLETSLPVHPASDPSTENDGEAVVLIADLARFYQRVVEELPEPLRTVYRMARERRMSYQDIGRELAMTHNQVRKYIIAVHRELEARFTRAGWPGLVMGTGILGARRGWNRLQGGEERAG
jgi:RNA polymerase sigma factor (sigma-70 family)